MTLGHFYDKAEKFIINDLAAYRMNQLIQSGEYTYHGVSILMIDDSPFEYFKQNGMISTISLGKNIQNILQYAQVIGEEKFDIVNCRFVLKHYTRDLQLLTSFIGMMHELLKSGGYLIGFILNTSKLNEIFTDTTEIAAGGYTLKYNDTHDNAIDITTNNEIINVPSFDKLLEICDYVGFVHVNNVLLEQLHYNSLYKIKLADHEKLFGFLNYIFIFRKL